MRGKKASASSRYSTSPKKSRFRKKHSPGTPSPVYTYGEVFPDGALIDLVQEAGDLKLCVFSGENRKTASEVQFRGRLFRPALLPRSVQRWSGYSRNLNIVPNSPPEAALPTKPTSRGLPSPPVSPFCFDCSAGFYASAVRLQPGLLALSEVEGSLVPPQAGCQRT
jgi:hypothetical protein